MRSSFYLLAFLLVSTTTIIHAQDDPVVEEQKIENSTNTEAPVVDGVEPVMTEEAPKNETEAPVEANESITADVTTTSEMEVTSGQSNGTEIEAPVKVNESTTAVPSGELTETTTKATKKHQETVAENIQTTAEAKAESSTGAPAEVPKLEVNVTSPESLPMTSTPEPHSDEVSEKYSSSHPRHYKSNVKDSKNNTGTDTTAETDKEKFSGLGSSLLTVLAVMALAH